MPEYEKQQELQLTLQTMKESYDEKVQKLKEGHVRALEDMTHFYEVKLQEKELELCQCQDASRQQLREFEEIKKQIEEDGDLELHDIRVTYERKLWEKKEDNLKLTGETRVMKKKFTSLQKEIDDRNLDIEKLKVEQQKQYGVIRALEKDIMGLQRKIQERDETIKEKENRFYGLKKNNEELEKFRFLLENEIDKLKKQIEPRENEVKKMKEQVHVMEAELKQFHKKSTHMELTISQQKLMLKAMDKEKQKETMKVKDVKAVLHRVKTDLHNCVGFIQEPKKLKENIRQIYRRYVHQSDVVEITGVDADVQREFIRQQDQMQRNMDSLRKKLAKDNKVHEAKNIKLIKENTALIKETNDLRMEVKQLRAQIHHYEIQKGFNKNRSKSATYIKPTLPVAPRVKFEGVSENIIQQQRLEIQRLKQEILGQSQGQGRDQSFDLQTLSSNKLSAIST
ncbi:cilia- and flagella-associated protein 57-like [Tachysurus fulvidraco]|uniref:cilia- and flagella-associated protein 57-like n=1 Tax=Tachysurus fulvidraco TaxID=1234273 RepID=UPI000F4D96D3|nr:cilia- and flagella-associated protein 57-like [Tachysurus fulvidraco]XP_026988373.1 cilia- and flagella-associated protein 57-like [Tachysurus fulvidraco]XP_026988374.1 cilia- and flagella-associated protein 57-like [Tachysurus fulvidraco]